MCCSEKVPDTPSVKNFYFNYNIGIVHFADVFSKGRWEKDRQSLAGQDPRLSRYVERLPEICLKSRADNTVKKYKYAFNKFAQWCSKFQPSISSLPASDLYVSLYLVYLTDCNSSSKIEEAVYAISWAHKLAGLPDPCSSSLVTSTREGSKRITSRPVIKKEPITPEMLKSLVTVYGNNTTNLYHVRTLTMCLIGYAGFLRFSEIVNLRMCDIKFFPDHVLLFIVKSKTDVYKGGSEVFIARTFTSTCPVSMLEKYLSLANIDKTSDEFIFRALSFCKKTDTYKLRSCGSSLTYTRAREILLNALEVLGLDKNKFGLHSLRSGGATAANTAGISDRLFKKHGRWRSDKAKDGYVRENLKEKLSVTQNLGL